MKEKNKQILAEKLNKLSKKTIELTKATMGLSNEQGLFTRIYNEMYKDNKEMEDNL